ncbi:hypothetical protein [Azospirillum sp. Sh1]|uniref:hypothetical protein n=1 Tax=Azospirillum sp. Sh1 TaxID=2607285 RepID=UPI0011ED7097|nr:hypothetical protein [Azospirillum sp. Sh1]KAA0573422.1 hypothetical protein FZ029_20810 [Azospirillum sp. Sh1]
MNALAPTAAAAAPMPFGQLDPFTAALMADVDADAKAAASKSADRFRFKDAGEYYLRLVPSKGFGTQKPDGTWNTRWFHSFGTHAFKPPGYEKKVWFGCLHHTYGQACPLCAAVATGKNNPMVAEIADEAYASRRYLVSGQFFDPVTRTFNPVVPIELAKTQFEKIKGLLLVSKTFFALQGGYVFKVVATPRSQGQGMEIAVSDASPFDTGITDDDLLDLEEIVRADIIEKNAAVASFTGDLLRPLAQQPGQRSAGGFAAVGAPNGFPGALPPPSAAPAGFPGAATPGYAAGAQFMQSVQQPAQAMPGFPGAAASPAAPAFPGAAAPAVAPAGFPGAAPAAAVAQPQPAAAPQPTVIDVPAQPVAPSPAPQPAAAPAAVQPAAAQPAPVQPAATSAEALAAELDSILGGL